MYITVTPIQQLMCIIYNYHCLWIDTTLIIVRCVSCVVYKDFNSAIISLL